MAVVIRLARHGRKKRPFYRIVAADRRSPRDGSFLEILGTYDPKVQGPAVLVQDRIAYWLSQGAMPSDFVASLLKLKQTPAPEAALS